MEECSIHALERLTKRKRTSAEDDSRTESKESDPLSRSSLHQNKTNPTVRRILTPLSRDVMLGRGKPFQIHPGNRRMLGIVQKHKDRYNTVPRERRREYAELVLDEVRANGGRFLKLSKAKKDENGEQDWTLVTERTVQLDKISHALRSNKKPEIYHDAIEATRLPLHLPPTQQTGTPSVADQLVRLGAASFSAEGLIPPSTASQTPMGQPMYMGQPMSWGQSMNMGPMGMAPIGLGTSLPMAGLMAPTPSVLAGLFPGAFGQQSMALPRQVNPMMYAALQRMLHPMQTGGGISNMGVPATLLAAQNNTLSLVQRRGAGDDSPTTKRVRSSNSNSFLNDR